MPKQKLYIVPKGPAQPPQIPNNLPIQPAHLLGRVSEVETVCDLLTQRTEPPLRLLTLVGPGGVGKTSLALQVAQELLYEFEDGVYFVELAPIVEADLIIPTVASTLQIREEPNVPLLDTLKTRLQDKRMLVVLDNFEQVIPAGSEVAKLLGVCPHLKLLVTSRTILGLRNEQEFAVPPLSMPEQNVQELALERREGFKRSALSAEKDSIVQTLLQYGAIKLFAQRASTLQSDFELTADNANAVVEICRRVDGLPLAIELVAAHARLLSPKAILARLTHPLRLLSGGPQDAPDRHRTMRATIEWSYRLLDEEEQRLFRRLSVFVGGFEVRVAEAVCNEGRNLSIESDDPAAIDVLEGLWALVDKSLVRRLEQSEDGEWRLTMLETVREYAWERLQENGESATIARCHAEYFLALSEEAEPHLTGPEQRAWVARLDAEHNNLRAVLSRCLPSADHATSPSQAQGLWSVAKPSFSEQPDSNPQATWIGLRLAGALGQFWAMGNVGEGRRWLAAALEAAEPLDEGDSSQVETGALAKAQIKALNGAGNLARLSGDFPVAKQALHSGLEISRSLGDQREVAKALTNLGMMALLRGDFAEARRYLNESLAIRRDLGLELEAGYCLTQLGNVAMLEENYAEARQLHEEGLAIKRKVGDKEGVGHSLHSLATIARRQGIQDEARRLDEETLAIARELGNKQGIAYSLRDLGKVAHAQGDYPMALRSFLESLVLFNELEDVMPTIDCLMGLAQVVARTEQPEQSVRIFGTAYALLESTEGQLDPADSTAYERDLTTLRARLSEKTFTKAWEEGRAMTLDDALQIASQYEGARPRARGRPRERVVAGLTPREYEVVSLVTQGLSNVEIAHSLILSERTVEMHVSNALRKLELTTRTQLAAWAVEQGLRTTEPTQS